jgi:hypothetical protein
VSAVNVYGVVRDYDTDLDVFGVVYEWETAGSGPEIILCMEALGVFTPGADAVGVFRNGDVARGVFASGAEAVQVGCCH